MSSSYNCKCNNIYIFTICIMCLHISKYTHKHFVCVTDIHLFYNLIVNATLMAEDSIVQVFVIKL